MYYEEQSNYLAANISLVNAETSRILRNPKVHYRDYNSPAPVAILRHINPTHDPKSYLQFQYSVGPYSKESAQIPV
jgi:hypothetical protein